MSDLQTVKSRRQVPDKDGMLIELHPGRLDMTGITEPGPGPPNPTWPLEISESMEADGDGVEGMRLNAKKIRAYSRLWYFRLNRPKSIHLPQEVPGRSECGNVEIWREDHRLNCTPHAERQEYTEYKVSLQIRARPRNPRRHLRRRHHHHHHRHLHHRQTRHRDHR